ncbi:unnamed protein product [Prorocentrum cordatum]|uniref:Uncharacterized protein n=1 Tax=Prorocentrum cordatum TaxID=2364126 RepID=A0ABN9V1E1_9DINO|nr:unnamed protein product [Polarella glacialis]
MTALRAAVAAEDDAAECLRRCAAACAAAARAVARLQEGPAALRDGVARAAAALRLFSGSGGQKSSTDRGRPVPGRWPVRWCVREPRSPRPGPSSQSSAVSASRGRSRASRGAETEG